ncbi:SIR2 family protein [Clostridium botulinum]|uniref:SIR2 family protein n=1 Tax=Clostridium botulinum TaxID=1491 RepID=UPI0009482ABF|nr:SIR2 family protein [Clostridium botulinum]MBN3361698.1 hypothetical protein [Clostridium botulinum]
MVDKFEQEVKQIFSKFDLKPFLFVGAGLSIRYYKLPDWKRLLMDITEKYIDVGNNFAFASVQEEAENEISDRINKIQNFEEHSHGYFMKGDEKKFNTYPIIASKLCRKFNQKFYSSGGKFPFELKQHEVLSLKRHEISPFKLLVAKYLESIKFKTNEYFDEIRNFKEMEQHLAGIITTNYDDFLESHLQFPVYIGQNDLFNVNTTYKLGEIYKIHGCLSQPNSIILNEEDYTNIYERYQYLSAKLLTFFIEHPIIFIGYSISDKNIKDILVDINKCLNSQTKEKIANRLIFIERTDDVNKQAIIPFQEQASGLMFHKIVLKDFNILYKAILEVNDSIPTRIVRLVQDKIATLVKTTDSTKKVYYGSELENPNVSDDKLVVFIGTKDKLSTFGYAGMRIQDIHKDVVFNNIGFKGEELFELSLPIMPYIERSKIPLWKYMKDCGYKEEYARHIIKKPSEVITRNLISQKYVRLVKECLNINDIIKLQLQKNVEIAAVLYKVESFEIDEIEMYLKNNFKSQIDNKNNKTNFRKLITAYDCLKYNIKAAK